MNYVVQITVPTGLPWEKYDMHDVFQLSGIEKVYFSIAGKNAERKSWLVPPERKGVG